LEDAEPFDPLTVVARGAAVYAARHAPPPPQPNPQATLRAWLSSPGLALPVPLAGSATLGRAPDATIRLEDPRVSRDHARVQWDQARARFVVEDLGSRWGTTLNAAPLTPGRAYTLVEGDRI